MSTMQGKVVLISGATDGIGEVTARELARMGAEVVIIGRSRERCLATVERIQQQTQNDRVFCIVADLSRMSEVRQAAQQFLSTHDKLDILINNVGAMYAQRRLSADGYEMMLALNHLSPFLLTHLLLDVLKTRAAAAGEARIINVSSEAHRFVSTLDLDDIQHEKRFTFGVYNETKLMNILFTYELAERLRGTNVTVNALHPGLVRSRFGKDNTPLVAAYWTLFQAVAGISVEAGAQTTLYLASSADMTRQSGRYYDRQKERRSSDLSYSIALRRRLWQMSELLTNIPLSNASASF